jgi:hypothetical protein
MSDRSMWKMLHLLHTLPPGQNGLNDKQLADAGIYCGGDTINPLVSSGAVLYQAGLYTLSDPARRILETCVVANRRWSSDDMWVDHPSVFVVMPFSEPWSDSVYRAMIKPAIVEAGLRCIRGDQIARVGDLAQNIWGSLLHAGIVVAEVSVPNPNVFYELGLTHALGKDAILLRQVNSKIPADFGGAHYHEYDLPALDAGKDWLRDHLEQWAEDAKSNVVKAILGR